MLYTVVGLSGLLWVVSSGSGQDEARARKIARSRVSASEAESKTGDKPLMHTIRQQVALWLVLCDMMSCDIFVQHRS